VVDWGQIVDRPEDATRDGHSTQLPLIIVVRIDLDRILKITIFFLDGPADTSGSHCDIIPVYKIVNGWLRVYAAHRFTSGKTPQPPGPPKRHSIPQE
jgi:hypothetical protein